MSKLTFSRRNLIVRTITACLAAALLISAAPGHGPKLNPVMWSLSTDSVSVAPGSTIVLHLHAQVADGYHLYSLTTPRGGPIATAISLKEETGFENVRVFQPAPNRHADPVLNIPVETFTGDVDFPVEVHLQRNLGAGSRTLVVQTRYQSCSSEICLPPVQRSAEVSITIASGLRVSKALVPPTFHLVSSNPHAKT